MKRSRLLKNLQTKMMDNHRERCTVMEAAHNGMGTEMTHRIFGDQAAEALQAVQMEAQRLECLLSRFLSQSDISRINGSAGKKCEKISPETFDILQKASDISKLSGGLFDVTVGPLADLWDYKHASEPPPDEKIKQILSIVDYRDLKLDASQKTAGLNRTGQSLDLGGIGKGFASDRFMEILRDYGIVSAFSNIGGNVSTLGRKPDGSAWQVGIRHPRHNGLIGAVAVAGKAVVTSGDYERYFIDRSGRRFHHILNPFTGYPGESGLASVTVVSDSAMTADALSTAMFVAGLEIGLAFLQDYPHTQAIFVDTGLQLYVTRGLRHCFKALAGIKVNYL